MTWIRITAVSVITLLVLAWAVVRPEQLYVERVVFEGLARATEAEVRHLADLRNGVTIWSVDPVSLSQRVQRHPWIEQVEVERAFPDTVVVRVSEYTPIALVSFDGALLYVDDSGVPFLGARSDDLDYPVVTGITRSLEERHPDLPKLVLRDALWLIDQLDARKLIPRDQVSEVRFHATRGFTVVTMGARRAGASEVLVGLGDYELQLRRLAALLGSGVDLSQPLHVDLAPRNVAIVRPLDAAPVEPERKASAALPVSTPFLAP